MTTKTLESIVELWPSLSDEVQQDIVDLAEGVAGRSGDLVLSAEEERLIEQSREDFKHGRFLEADAYHARMREFLDRLKTQSQR